MRAGLLVAAAFLTAGCAGAAEDLPITGIDEAGLLFARETWGNGTRMTFNAADITFDHELIQYRVTFHQETRVQVWAEAVAWTRGPKSHCLAAAAVSQQAQPIPPPPVDPSKPRTSRPAADIGPPPFDPGIYSVSWTLDNRYYDPSVQAGGQRVDPEIATGSGYSPRGTSARTEWVMPAGGQAFIQVGGSGNDALLPTHDTRPPASVVRLSFEGTAHVDSAGSVPLACGSHIRHTVAETMAGVGYAGHATNGGAVLETTNGTTLFVYKVEGLYDQDQTGKVFAPGMADVDINDRLDVDYSSAEVGRAGFEYEDYPWLVSGGNIRWFIADTWWPEPRDLIEE